MLFCLKCTYWSRVFYKTHYLNSFLFCRIKLTLRGLCSEVLVEERTDSVRVHMTPFPALDASDISDFNSKWLVTNCLVVFSKIAARFSLYLRNENNNFYHPIKHKLLRNYIYFRKKKIVHELNIQSSQFRDKEKPIAYLLLMERSDTFFL